MNPYFFFFIYALAVFRLSLMFSKEKGPCNIFGSFRDLICRKAKCLTEGTQCLWCWSIWVSAVLTIYWLCGGPVLFPLFLALSAIAIILDQAFTQHE